MSEKKKVIFIDSENQKVTEVFIEKNDCLKETYAMIGNGCHTVAIAIHLSHADAIMGDDEGYFNEGLKGFMYERMFVYGNAVVWGSDDEGDLDDPKTTAGEISSKITWVGEDDSAVIRERVMNTPPTIMFWDY